MRLIVDPEHALKQCSLPLPFGSRLPRFLCSGPLGVLQSAVESENRMCEAKESIGAAVQRADGGLHLVRRRTYAW